MNIAETSYKINFYNNFKSYMRNNKFYQTRIKQKTYRGYFLFSRQENGDGFIEFLRNNKSFILLK